MIHKIKFDDINCDIVCNEASDKVAYMIYPGIEALPSEWIEQTSVTFTVSIVVVYIPADQWNNYLTPWAAPGETANSDPFLGKAPDFLKRLKTEIIPSIENSTGKIRRPSERDLIGVSLSGLFTLWQWMNDSTFSSIASLSGSFWFPGFLDWFDRQEIPQKNGRAFFLLGKKEPHAWLKEYRTVGQNTEAIVQRLKRAGIQTEFTWVPGDHFADSLSRAHLAFQSLYPPSESN